MEKNGPQMDQKIEMNENDKIECFSLVVEMLEEIIDRLKSVSKTEKVHQMYKKTQEFVNKSVSNPLSLWDRLFDKVSCTRKGQKTITMKPTNIDLSPPENVLKSKFQAINVLRRQLS